MMCLPCLAVQIACRYQSGKELRLREGHERFPRIDYVFGPLRTLHG